MFAEIQEQVAKLMESKLEECKRMTREQRLNMGIDPRSMYDCWFTDKELIVSEAESRSLNYYGGFEYVDLEYVMAIGGYVIYSGEDSRVQSVLQCLNGIEGRVTELLSNVNDIEEGNGLDDEQIDALVSAFQKGEHVTILCEATDGFYDVQLKDGTVVDALSGHHLQCID